MHQPVSRTTAPHYAWGDGCDGWHLLADPGLSVIEECVPPGRGEVRHYHRAALQFFYVLSGTATLEIDGHELRLRPGCGCTVPPGCPHQLCNDGDEPLRMLVISAPPSHGDRVIASPPGA